MGSFEHFIYTNMKSLLLQLMVKKRFIFSNKVNLLPTKIIPFDLFSLAWCKLESRSVVWEITGTFIHLFTKLFIRLNSALLSYLCFSIIHSIWIKYKCRRGKRKTFSKDNFMDNKSSKKVSVQMLAVSFSFFAKSLFFCTQVFHIPFFVGIGANMTNLERIFYHNKILR